MAWSRRGFLGLLGLAGAAGAVAACSNRSPGSAADVGAEDLRYGDHRAQHVELALPGPAEAGPYPVAVVIHGGFWSSQYDLSLMRPLVPDLLADGWAVANIDYRGVGHQGGGWPGTFDDVEAAVGLLAGRDGLDLATVVTIGHSAGGHLAVWLAGQADAAVRITGAVSQAGVLDLVQAEVDALGGRAAAALLGGSPEQVPDRYRSASPAERVPIGVPVELVHGVRDTIVPLDQSRRYLDRARAAGDQVALTEVPGDHFAIIDPSTPAWQACRDALLRLR